MIALKPYLKSHNFVLPKDLRRIRIGELFPNVYYNLLERLDGTLFLEKRTCPNNERADLSYFNYFFFTKK